MCTRPGSGCWGMQWFSILRGISTTPDFMVGMAAITELIAIPNCLHRNQHKDRYMKRHSFKASVCIGLVIALMDVATSSPIVRAEQGPASGQASSAKDMPVSLKIASGDLLH